MSQASAKKTLEGQLLALGGRGQGTIFILQLSGKSGDEQLLLRVPPKLQDKARALALGGARHVKVRGKIEQPSANVLHVEALAELPRKATPRSPKP